MWASGRNSTSKSMSLSTRASPRAAEPNNASSRTWYCRHRSARQISSTSTGPTLTIELSLRIHYPLQRQPPRTRPFHSPLQSLFPSSHLRRVLNCQCPAGHFQRRRIIASAVLVVLGELFERAHAV